MLLVAVDTMPLIYLALGMTGIGIFTKYKLFLIIAIGPILFILYEYAEIVDPHAGMPVILACLSGWILFNIYLALFGGSNE